MSALRELRHETRADVCLECGKCSSMCPLGTRADFSARRIAGQDLHDEIEGQGIGVGRCLTCAACEERCPQGVRFTEFVRGLREMIPTAQRRPCPHGAALRESSLWMSESPPERSLDWITDDLRVAEEGEVALFVGCAPLFESFFADDRAVPTTSIARSAVRVLNQLGIEPVVVDDERCCGHDLLWSGDREAFKELARANLQSFRARGVKHVVTACAECARTWMLDYPSVDDESTPRVQHIIELMAEKTDADSFEPRNDAKTRVTYQDPCRLSRHLSVIDEPRQVLSRIPGVELTEMARHGRDAVCCGTSGFMHCDQESRRLQAERLAGAEATRAETVLTACPKCWIHFACAIREDQRRGRRPPAIQPLDFTVFAASRLRGADEPMTALASGEMGGSS